MVRLITTKDMKKSMLNYCKEVLNKVSFDKRLFIKEYNKSSKFLLKSEMIDLHQWAKEHFDHLLAPNPLHIPECQEPIKNETINNHL